MVVEADDILLAPAKVGNDEPNSEKVRHDAIPPSRLPDVDNSTLRLGSGTRDTRLAVLQVDVRPVSS